LTLFSETSINTQRNQRADEMKPSSFSPLALVGFVLAILVGLVAMLAGFGSRWGWWNFRIGFIILRWAAYGGIIAALISVIGAISTWHGVFHRSFLISISGLVIGILVFAIPGWYWRAAQRVPPIHDITTDTQNPPRFVSILPLRKYAPNPAEYGGPKIAEKQLEGYPDLAPAISSIPVDKAFERALMTAQKMGWKIVDANRAEGRIEATDTTFWFGFKDDIVIRVSPADHGSRVDIRSVSRVGRSDIGTNAKRIRRYLKELKQAGLQQTTGSR
jgi:uncharacterized protein (DUF1499 family)